MNDKNGIETARKIREIDQKVIIIFLTNYINYVFDSFRVNAFQFLKKPVSRADFENDFNRAIDAYKKMHCKYEIKFKNEINILEISDITHIEVFDHSIFVHCNSTAFQKCGKLKDEINYLKQYNFAQCHKSILVNMAHIKNIEEASIILRNNKCLILSKKYRQPLLKSFNKYLLECCI